MTAQVRYSKDYHIEEGWGKVIHTYMSKRKLKKVMVEAFVDPIIYREITGDHQGYPGA